MMRPIYLASLPILLFSAPVMADMIYTPEGAKPLPPKQTMQVFSENAVGQKQGTIVDENGNLKVVEQDMNPVPGGMVPSNGGDAQNQAPQPQMQPGSIQQNQSTPPMPSQQPAPMQQPMQPQQSMQPQQPMQMPQSAEPQQPMPMQQPMQPQQPMPSLPQGGQPK